MRNVDLTTRDDAGATCVHDHTVEFDFFRRDRPSPDMKERDATVPPSFRAPDLLDAPEPLRAIDDLKFPSLWALPEEEKRHGQAH
jgi:hypothetical protein